MSRIDEALRIAEGEKPAATTADGPHAVHPSPFTEFRREGADKPAEGSPAPLRSVDAPKAAPQTVPPPPPRQPRAEIMASRRPLDDNLNARLVSPKSSSMSLEQYRRVVAVLHEEQAEGQLKTVMITSALPGEGKTLTVVNLALTLSESYGRRVLVIDADLRCPSVHTLFGIENTIGLSEALEAGSRELPLTEVSPTLSVMTAGKPGAAPLVGLSSPRMHEVIKECEGLFDWVLVDTPPVGVLPDAQVLVRLVGGVILVIGAGSTPAAAVERAVAELGGPDNLVGTVLNRVEQNRIPDSGYYGYYGRRQQ